MPIEQIVPYLPPLFIAAFLILIIVFRNQLKDAIYGTLFETVVDGGLSFADELLGIGLIPGLDIGDYIAAVLIFKRSMQKSGIIVAVLASLEAANFIIGSFIPGIDWIFNVFPIYPILKVINGCILLFFPHTLLTEGTEPLAQHEKKKSDAMIVVIEQVQKENVIHTMKDKYAKASTLFFRKKYMKAKRMFSSINHTLHHEVQQKFKTMIQEIHQMHDFLMQTSQSYANENQVYVPYKVKQCKEAYAKENYTEALLPLVTLHQKLLYQVNSTYTE